MGSSKKHKDKDRSREHKKKHKHRSRSRSKEKKHKHRDRDRSKDRDRKRKRDREEPDSHGQQYSYIDSYDQQNAEIPGLDTCKIDYDNGQGGYFNVESSGGQYRPQQSGPYEDHFEDGEIGEELEPVATVKEEIPGLDFGGAPSVPVPAAESSGGSGISLSIGETNKLRAKLGLKPLDTGDGKGDDNKPVKKEDVHVPAVNMAQLKKTKDLKEKLEAAKEKRRINKLLGKVKTLGESDEEDDAFAWVKKSRKIDKERKMADQRAKVLEEMDSEFGIGDLVEEEFGVAKPSYTSKDLRGLKVQHGQDAFEEGRTVVLTLKDRGVLDEDDEPETLMNVNMEDLERAKKNIENKKTKPDYKPYDEPEFDEYGMVKPKQILGKYDEEIDGAKIDSFKLGSGGRYIADHERIMKQMKTDIEMQGHTLSLPPPVLASEFYTETEMETFKKPKTNKIRKLRKKTKMVKADDLLPPPDDAPDPNHSSKRRREAHPFDTDIPMDVMQQMGHIPGFDFAVERAVKMEEDTLDDDDVNGPDEDLEGLVIDDDAGIELGLALEKARKLKLKTQTKDVEKNIAEKLAQLPSQDVISNDSDVQDSDEDELILRSNDVKANITLNQTSEFCRTLGEIPTYGQAGNRQEDEDELMDFERELQEERRKEMEEDPQNPGWQEVELDTQPVEIENEAKAVLDDEPVVGSGVAAALSLAQKKGYVEHKEPKKASAARHTEMEAENYSIEDKRYDDLDEKFRKRDRYGGGIISEFKEKDGYKPNISLDYVDEMGRDMTQKEAFRYLSHRFHGKGSGKMKQEKRKKKIEEAQLMKSMSSTDTPLGTASMLGAKLEREKVPFLLLSGGTKALTAPADRISK